MDKVVPEHHLEEHLNAFGSDEFSSLIADAAQVLDQAAKMSAMLKRLHEDFLIAQMHERPWKLDIFVIFEVFMELEQILCFVLQINLNVHQLGEFVQGFFHAQPIELGKHPRHTVD